MGPRDVRIAVRGVGLNFPDLLMIEGKYQHKSDFPFSPGMECVGEIIELGAELGADGGSEAEKLTIGQRVIAHPWRDCLAEQVVSPAEFVYGVEDKLSDEQAAGFALTHGTVLHALKDRGRLRPGETLLVLGAAGGVGINAVTMGKAMGATVIAAVGSDEKCALTRQYGADHTINYRQDDQGELRHQVKALTDGRGADVIFDAVGGDMCDQAMRCINWGGRLLIIGFAGGRISEIASNLVLIKCVEVVGVAYSAFSRRQGDDARANMTELMGMYRAGQLKPHVSMSFPLAETTAALKAMAGRRSTGKIVVTL